MKKCLIGMMVTLIAGVGMARADDNDANVRNSQIDGIYTQFGEKLHAQVHRLTNECMAEVSKIPQPVKVQWCQQQVQKRISQVKQQQAGITRAGQVPTYLDQEMRSAQDQWDQCQYIAGEILIERCASLEREVGNYSRSLASSESFNSRLLRY